MMQRFATAGIAMAIALSLASCGKKKEEKAPPPAVVENGVKETELTTIRLTPEAEGRVGIKTAVVGEQYVGNARTFSGEIISVPGRAVTITAPFAGRLMAAGGRPSPTAGQQVGSGQALYSLVILPSERDIVSAPEDVTQRQVQYEVSRQKVERASRMYADKSGSLRAKQEAEAELAGARASLRVARARTELLSGNTASADRLSTLTIQAPTSGVVQRVMSSPGQVVSAGAPLMDISFVSTVWVRVPVYAGDAEGIARNAPAQVGSLSRFGGAGSVTARPVSGPQTADAAGSSVDLFYELPNEDGTWRPGQRVSVSLPFGGSASGLAVPLSSVVYDIHGGTWVYQTDSARIYSRKRVEIKSASGEWALISRGIAAGARIVTVGAAELWGTEFGGGK